VVAAPAKAAKLMRLYISLRLPRGPRKVGMTASPPTVPNRWRVWALDSPLKGGGTAKGHCRRRLTGPRRQPTGQ
jgi:hypothetical protein